MTGSAAARSLALAGLGLALGVALPASAESLGVGWEGEITDSRVVDGYTASGETLRVPVAFEFTGPPDSEITNLSLLLEPADPRCQSQAYVQPFAEGDGDGGADPEEPPTTPDTPDTSDTTVPPPDTPDEDVVIRAVWYFAVDPGCNGVYDLRAFAEADPGGPAAPGDPGTQSEAIEVEDVSVSLAAPRPAGMEALLGDDRRVTVRWTAPPTWTDADGAPVDATGYRVQRVAGDGTVVTVGETDTAATSVVDDDLVTAPDGRYRYRVVALRTSASGEPVASAPAESDVVVGAAAPTATTVTPRPVGGRAGGASRGGRPVAAPTTAFDPGFDPELDYGDVELGSPNASLPADVELFDNDDPIGAGVLVPSAVALCLAVWAGHLRHLSHRASQPAP